MEPGARDPGERSHCVPSAESFRIYHLKHHKYQGDYLLDADLASEWEARLVGNGTFGKLLWELGFALFQSLRALRFSRASKISFLTPWVVVNIVVVLGTDVLIWWTLGPTALAYLVISLVFSIGPHPLGARWIQEHYLTWDDDQETSSYYGPANRIALNVGYHNEHHDFPFVPWTRLPRVNAIGAAWYDRPSQPPIVDPAMATVPVRSLPVALQPCDARRQHQRTAAAGSGSTCHVGSMVSDACALVGAKVRLSTITRSRRSRSRPPAPRCLAKVAKHGR